MATARPDWEKITPQALIPAVKHIRETFNDSRWKCSEVTENLCFAALHPETADQVALAPYESVFDVYRRILGSEAIREFDIRLKNGTPPAIFIAYFDAFREGLGIEVRRLFYETLQIGLTNVRVLNMHPVEWAKTHLEFLIYKTSPLVGRWIKSVCDKQDYSSPPLTTEDFEEVVFRKTWRAPKLVYMQPSGNATYDPANAWTRVDTQRTENLLRGLTERFTVLLEVDLSKAAGDAHVACAQRGDLKVEAKGISQRTEGHLQPSVSKQQDSGSKEKSAREKLKLGPKKRDLSALLDSVKLTDRQRDCLSLRLEYELPVTEIAHRLGIHRKTVDEHLEAATKRCDHRSAKWQRDKNLAKVKPGGLSD